MAAYARYSIFRSLLNLNLSSQYIECLNRGKLSYSIYRKCRKDVRILGCIQPRIEFHTSYNYFKRRKTAEERKAPKIIEYTKSKGEFVDIWRSITPAELAQIYNKDISYIYDIFLNQIRDPNIPIEDIKLLQQAITRSGRRMRIIGKPSEKVVENIDKDIYPRPPPLKAELHPRPPVVTVMGHVDHGKTTLLDALRNSRVVDQEFGGITQHIGAFTVTLQSGAKITFLDTPGHAAFSAMRARGANLTDIVVLVVAADDGVMEQTVESIKMAQNAKVPILVAINKIDSPKANIERTQKMLATVGLQVEHMGGDIQAIPISALKKRNLDQLTEAILVQAELAELGGDPKGPVEAVVVESKVDQYRGKLCTVVVQRGTLKNGSILVADTVMAKVRVLRDAEGNILKEVSPGYPSEIEGWRDLPPAGELVLEVESERKARDVIKYRESLKEQEKLEKEAKVIMEKREQYLKGYKEQLEKKRKMGRFKLRREGPRKPEIEEDTGPPKLPIIVKADVDGTLEAILDVLSTYHSQDCSLDLINFEVGSITQNDIELAETFNGIIYAFNTDLPHNLKQALDKTDVTIKHHNVIYKLIDDIKEEINLRLPKKEIEEIFGEATVQQQFEINVGRRKVPIAGCKCISGLLKKSAQFRIVRNGCIIHTGSLSSMRHLKSEVDIIKADTECGLQLEDSSINFEKGDIIVCFEKKLVEQKTDWDPGF